MCFNNMMHAMHEYNNNNNVEIYIALYPKAQSALQYFVGDFARLLI